MAMRAKQPETSGAFDIGAICMANKHGSYRFPSKTVAREFVRRNLSILDDLGVHVMLLNYDPEKPREFVGMFAQDFEEVMSETGDPFRKEWRTFELWKKD